VTTVSAPPAGQAAISLGASGGQRSEKGQASRMFENFAVKKYFIRRKNAENILYLCRKINSIWQNIFINTKIGLILVGKMQL
jgi:hypothetical protein